MAQQASAPLSRFLTPILRAARVATWSALFACAGAAHAAAPAANAGSAVQGVGEATLVRVSARVVDVDTDSNSVTLEGPRGNDVMVEVDPAVGDVHQIKVGDVVSVVYRNALLVRADKVSSNGIRERIDTDATTPISGGETTSVRSVEIVATVEKVDRKKRLVTLRGPSRTEVFQVPAAISLENLKVGDSVRAEFRSATAVEITRGGTPVK
ncbi:MAG: copper-binding protein [Pararobbsia sp.]